MTKQLYDYHDGATLLKGYLSYHNTNASPKPGILVCPDWTGRNTFADTTADTLAALGYVGFALDVYGEGIQGKTNDEKALLMRPFIENRGLLRQRLLAALNTIKQFDFVDPTQVGIIGFCFGGLCALDLARSGSDIQAAVSFHGQLTPPDLPQEKIKAKILVLHGYDDPSIPPMQVNAFAKEMTEAKVDWQIHLYGNTQHAFTNPLANSPEHGLLYNEVSAKRSFRAMEDFFRELFH